MSTVPNRPPGPRHNSNVGLGPVGADGMSGPEVGGAEVGGAEVGGAEVGGAEVGGAEVGGAAGTVPTPVQLVEFTDRRFRCFSCGAAGREHRDTDQVPAAVRFRLGADQLLLAF